jgi:Putative Flp pilus-assembly TadE/G-like
MMASIKFKRRRRSRQDGQAAVFLLLGMGLFLLGGIGLAVDMANLWMHREAAQNAADAACTAAAADMVSDAQNGITNAGGFTPGSAFLCSNNSSAAPCQYAGFNGYSATGLSSSASSEVSVDFPSSVSAVPVFTPGSNPPLPPIGTESGVPANAFVHVTVVDRMQSFFVGLLSGKHTMDLSAQSFCGAVLANSPVPVQVLSPNVNNALSVSGTLSVDGGPQRSIQVNSNSGSAVSGIGTINLQQGGPNSSGSDLGVTGGNGTTVNGGNVISPATPVSDPFAQLQAPSQPSITQTGPVGSAPTTTNGCPDTVNGCYEYAPGYYPNGICVGLSQACAPFNKVGTAIFDPGIYYVLNGVAMHRGSCVWPSTATGDGSGGTMFYFADNNSFTTNRMAGTGCPATSFTLASVGCTQSSSIPLSGSITGTSILLAPCQLPTMAALCNPNCGINYGDPLGTNDPLGEQRGMLFFQNRATGVPANANWNSSGGQFLLAGNIYIHQCVTSGNDTGVNCSVSSAYNDAMTFSTGCNRGSNYIVFGQLVADELSISCLTADINPGAVYYVIKADLLQ